MKRKQGSLIYGKLRMGAWKIIAPGLRHSPNSEAPRMLLNELSRGESSMTDTPPAPRPRRSWRAKFRVAFRGMKLGIRGHSSFFVHFFFAALVLAAGMVLRCGALEWCLLLGCIGMVFTAELFNSAIETVLRGLDESTKPGGPACLDISADARVLAR